MAEKEEKKTDPNKDDELDALLDSALEDFDKLSSAQNIPSHKVSSDQSNSEHVSSPSENKARTVKSCEDSALEDFGLNESDIEAAAAEFEKSMKAMLGDDKELLKQWNDFAEKATACNSGSENIGGEPLPEDVEAFEAHLLKTMKDMAEGAKDMSDSPECDENFFKAMADMNVNGCEPDFNQGIFPMMQGMMMNLLSKDVLYPALDELKTKYPSWLKERKSILKSDVYENYLQQYKLVCEICAEYDKENEKDSEETKKRRFDKLMNLMHKMQKCGQPPQELVGERIPLGMEGDKDGFPPNKCPMM